MQSFGLARIGRDAELKFTAGGDAVIQLALAFDYGKKVEGKRPTQWVSGSLWGKRAEALAQYLVKGQQVFVSMDEVHIRTYKKADGSEGYALEGKVSNIEFAGSRPEQQAAPAPAPAPARTQASGPVGFDDFDDIPFS